MIKHLSLLILIVFSLSVVGQTQKKPAFGSFTDVRDKKIYKTVTIGTQTWFAYNLSFNYPGSWCYNNTSDYCSTYGKLYSQEAALKACPDGWHLPSADEWLILLNYLGKRNVVGGSLKETGDDHWEEPNEGATNVTGFKALPGGYRDALTGSYFRIGKEVVFWSSTKLTVSDNTSWTLFLEYNSSKAFTENITLSNNNNGYSVRCIKNVITIPQK